MPRKILLLEARPFARFSQIAWDQLQSQASLDIRDQRGQGPDSPEFMDILKQAEILLMGNDLTLDQRLLAQAPRLKLVSKFGVGVDMIDLPACTSRGIIVHNSPGCNNQAVADQTIGMALALLRKIPLGHNSMSQGRWEQLSLMGRELWQKTLGLVGLGAIGQAVVQRAKGFDMKVVAYDPYWPQEFAERHQVRRMASLEELLPMADVISLHANLTPENQGMIDLARLRLMKPQAIIINCARGGLIKEADLHQALRQNLIAGAALDAWEQEPPADSPLLKLDNVLAMPHTAGLTVESLINMDLGAAEQIIQYLQGQTPSHVVNPEVL